MVAVRKNTAVQTKAAERWGEGSPLPAAMEGYTAAGAHGVTRPTSKNRSSSKPTPFPAAPFELCEDGSILPGHPSP